MKYLCLIYENEAAYGSISKEDMDKMMSEYFAFTNDTKAAGQYIGGEALQPTQSATTVRVRGGKVQTTDGPFAETKEQLGGYYLVEARDLNEAIQIAGRIPGARFGCVEVRPVIDFSAGA